MSCAWSVDKHSMLNVMLAIGKKQFGLLFPNIQMPESCPLQLFIDHMNFDAEGFESLVWIYGTMEGTIKPKTWEKIICKSFGGTHIPGDTFMADGYVNRDGLNVKTLNKKLNKGHLQTCDFVQCRCPLDEGLDIGKGVINTLVKKREESFNKFNLDRMQDVLVLHRRDDNEYSVRMFISEQEKYEDLNLMWVNNIAYLNSKKQWKLKRIPGNGSGFQTCVYVKTILDARNSIIDLKIHCDNEYDISLEEAKEKYAKMKESGNLK